MDKNGKKPKKPSTTKLNETIREISIANRTYCTVFGVQSANSNINTYYVSYNNRWLMVHILVIGLKGPKK